MTNPEAEQTEPAAEQQEAGQTEPTADQHEADQHQDGRRENGQQDAEELDAEKLEAEQQEAEKLEAEWREADRQATQRLEKAVLGAEQALIEFEIAVETFRVEVENFSRLHHQRLGPMYTRLDELDALIAEAVAARTKRPEDVKRAGELRALVEPMPGVEELFHGWIDANGIPPEADAMLHERPVQPPRRVRPGEEARRIYRELVRKAHPDLARDDAERERRDAFISRVNAAYALGDQEVLSALAAEWESGPAPEQPWAGRSEELYARLEWLAERKEKLAAAASELESSAIGAMLKMAPDDPDGLLDEIAEQLLAQVSERESRLAEMAG